MESTLEGCLIVRKDGNVIAIGHNDMTRRATIFYSVAGKEMGLEEFKELLTEANLPKS